MNDITVIIVGFVTVFIGMAAIVGLVYLLSYIVGLFSKNPTKKQKNISANQDETTKPIPIVDESQITEDAQNDEELMAAIVAAIEMYRDNNAGTGMSKNAGVSKDFKVVSFKRIGRGK